MWLHGAIFLLLGLIALLWHLSWIPREELADKRSRQLFLLLGLVGNLLGLLVTVRSLDVGLGEKARLLRRPRNYEEELIVLRDGQEPWPVTVKVPMLEGEDEEPESGEVLDEGELQRKELREELALFNEENGDEEYFYLPDEYHGHTYVWQRPRDSSGTLLAALFLVAAASTLVLKRREKESRQQKRGEALMLDYPEVIMRFTLLVQSGMTVRNVFARLAADHQEPDGRHPVYEELRTTCYEIEAGVSEMEAYHRFGERCGVVKYKTFSTLLVQNLQKGSRQLLDMLEKEAGEAWEERKRRARIQGEEAATRLLFPMILMMVCVMAIIMVPAMFSFYGT